jgi:hypothetical protein
MDLLPYLTLSSYRKNLCSFDKCRDRWLLAPVQGLVGVLSLARRSACRSYRPRGT